MAGALALPAVHRGRPTGGFLGVPNHSPEERQRANDVPTLYSTQRINHFDPQDLRTFQLRYWINNAYFKAGGPVFLMLGGESTADPIWISANVSWVTWAQQLGALLVMTEHRFYGLSQPFADLSTDNLQYLTSTQSLADHAALHAQVSTAYNLTSANKWVSFGGSYSGALSAWMRLKYPALISAAVATSGPVFAEVDFVEYLEVVTASLGTAKTGQQCLSAIQTASSQIDTLLTTPQGRSQLVTNFSLCAAPVSNLDVANFVSTVAGSFMGVVQYNQDNRAFEGAQNTNITVDVVCNMVTSASDPLTGYIAVSNLLNGAGPGPSQCLDISYTDMIAELQNTSLASPAADGGRQWTYQTCAEFGYFQSTDSTNQVFGTNIPVSFYVQQCTDIFGPLFNASTIAANADWVNDFYGGKDLEGSNIVLPNGSIDPWHALSVTDASNLPPSVTTVFMTGTAHCADMYPATPDDIPSLTAGRIAIFNTLSKWVS